MRSPHFAAPLMPCFFFFRHLYSETSLQPSRLQRLMHFLAMSLIWLTSFFFFFFFFFFFK